MSAPANTLLEEALAGWRFARQGFIAEVEAIPPESWDYRPHAHSRSVQEVVVHILLSGSMMVGELTRPDGDFTRQSIEAHFAEYGVGVPENGSAAVCLEELSRTLASGQERFRAVGEIHMLQLITQFDRTQATRLSWFQHGIAHEEYHRGQLTLYARGLGLVPALTRRIHGDDAK